MTYDYYAVLQKLPKGEHLVWAIFIEDDVSVNNVFTWTNYACPNLICDTNRDIEYKYPDLDMIQITSRLYEELLKMLGNPVKPIRVKYNDFTGIIDLC